MCIVQPAPHAEEGGQEMNGFSLGKIYFLFLQLFFLILKVYIYTFELEKIFQASRLSNVWDVKVFMLLRLNC